MKLKLIVAGDIDGFFGLMVDNLIQLLVLMGLCAGVCGFPMVFILKTVLPGAAVSLLVGNLFYAYQAYMVAKKEGREDVTALPYGINTVSLFAFIFFVIFPVYKATGNYEKAWKIGLIACLLSGIIEFLGSFIAEFIRKITPRAALLSALSGIAITFISMDFLIRTFQNPLVAFLPFGIILLQYFGKFKFPFHLPGGFVSVVAGSILAWVSGLWGKPLMDSSLLLNAGSSIGFNLPGIYIGEIIETLKKADIKEYASVIIPMGIFNVVGSLQNIESAEAAGDKFNTRDSLLVNGAGTIIGAFMGSPFPTTIYIGHPGWKALGARWGYSVMNGVFMSIVCFLGLMGLLQAIIPIEAGMAIVLWIGIIIGAQAFETSPGNHSPAIIIGLFPALAGWGMLLVQNVFMYADGQLQKILSDAKVTSAQTLALSSIPLDVPFLPYTLGGLVALSQGFLLSSMIWASISVGIIEKDFKNAAIWAISGAILSAIGLIHSFAFAGNAILNNYNIPAAPQFVVGYAILSILFFIASFGKTKE